MPDALSLRIGPNPMASVASVRFELAREQHVRIEVIDIRGRVVAPIADRPFPAGSATLRWDGRSAGEPVPGGVPRCGRARSASGCRRNRRWRATGRSA
jgi:hypothetical protein